MSPCLACNLELETLSGSLLVGRLDLGSGLLSEHMLFWTASRERKRWLRASAAWPAVGRARVVESCYCDPPNCLGLIMY